MKRLLVAEFLSLDGVMEAPEKWSGPYWNDEIAKWKMSCSLPAHICWAERHTGFLLGAWPSRKRGLR